MFNLMDFALLCALFNVVASQLEPLPPWLAPRSQCQQITIPMCQDLGYNYTIMPNLMGNEDQKEAEREIAAYMPLVAADCSPHIRFFLCSAFAPLCSEHVRAAVGGCRELCAEVAAGCAPLLAALGLAAPALLDCARYPARGPSQLCMELPKNSEPPHWAAPAPPPAAPPCASARLPDAWLAGWPALSLLSAAFALVTFCADPSRFRHPERAVVPLAACQAAAALAHLARAWSGQRAPFCGAAHLVEAPLGASCTFLFLIDYYFTLAADAWFLNLCVAWYLSAANEWSTEALERASAYFHAAAWGWAGAWTAAALALRRLALDELTGECAVEDGAAAALVGVPRGAPLGAALALAVGAGVALRRVRRALADRGVTRLDRLAARLAVLAALYWLASAGHVAATLAEARARPARRAMAALAAGECGAACATRGAALALARVALRSAAGAAAGAWAWSRKSCGLWARACVPPRKAPPPCCRAAPLLAPVTRPPLLIKRPPIALHVTHV